MKDRIQLLFVSLIFAALAWAFWRVAGRDGFLILIALANFGLISENCRLKRALLERN